MIKVEFCRTLDGTPFRELWLHRDQIPALGRWPWRNLKGIRCLRIVGPDIVQATGWNIRDWFFCKRVK